MKNLNFLEKQIQVRSRGAFELKIVMDEEDYRDFIQVIDSYYFDLTDEEINVAEVKSIFSMIPTSIHLLAAEWGYSDTEVRYKIYVWMKDYLSNKK